MEKREFDGEFRILDDVFRDMNEEAERMPKRETGGMLFGSFDESGDALTVTLERVELIPENKAERTAGHFGIDPDYSDRILDKYSPEYTYLGNWHSHLNYGGPSGGDYQQVARFFEANQNREYMIAIIMDRRQLHPPEFTPIAEVYRRADATERGYEVERVTKIIVDDAFESSDRTTHVGSLISGLDLRQSLTSPLLQLTDQIDQQTPIDADRDDGMAYLDEGGGVDEVVICYPVTFLQERSDGDLTMRPQDTREADGEERPNQTESDTESPAGDDRQTETEDSRDETDAAETDKLDVYFLISVPLVYPADEIYVDIASSDLTSRTTIDTFDAATLQEDPELFVTELNRIVTEKSPTIISQPFANALKGISE